MERGFPIGQQQSVFQDRVSLAVTKCPLGDPLILLRRNAALGVSFPRVSLDETIDGLVEVFEQVCVLSVHDQKTSAIREQGQSHPPVEELVQAGLPIGV